MNQAGSSNPKYKRITKVGSNLHLQDLVQSIIEETNIPWFTVLPPLSFGPFIISSFLVQIRLSNKMFTVGSPAYLVVPLYAH